MENSLKLVFERLLEEVSTKHYRFLYHEFNLENRLTGLIGPRGVGKTTLMLQYIKNHFFDLSNVFYFSACHIYFNSTTLYAFVEELNLTEGIDTFFIDEIHQYKNWNQELKNLYDGFPSIKIVFSGSSSLDLIKGGYDLSRRVKLYSLPGLSFREYINLQTGSDLKPISFVDLVENYRTFDAMLARIPKIKGLFQEYLHQGFYPFYRENPLSYYEKLLYIIDKTIYEDIAEFYNLKTANLHYFKKILNFLANIEPGTVSVHNLGKNLSIDDKTAMNYLLSLKETGLLNLVYASEGGNASLRRPEKIFLNNTNLQYAIQGKIHTPVKLGSVRELFFIQSFLNAGLEVFHSRKGDCRVENYLFEVGGKNKTRAQIKGEQKALVISDELMVSRKGYVPLMLAGFLY